MSRKNLLDRLEKVAPDYCPFVELAKIANDADTPLPERIACHKIIATYIEPKLKATEHKLHIAKFGEDLRAALLDDNQLEEIANASC